MSGIERIAAERKRQIEQEGWAADHDDQYQAGELAKAAAGYADLANDLIANGLIASGADNANWDVPCDWPWDDSWWKPSPDPIRNLEKAGALIAAEIDRLERAEIKESQALPEGWSVSVCTDNELVIHMPEGGGVVAQKDGDTVATQVLFDLVTALISGTAKREGDGE